MSVSLLSGKFCVIQQLAHSLLQTQIVTDYQVSLFWARPIFVPMDLHNFVICVVCFIHLFTYFVPVTFPFQFCINF